MKGVHVTNNHGPIYPQEPWRFSAESMNDFWDTCKIGWTWAAVGRGPHRPVVPSTQKHRVWYAQLKRSSELPARVSGTGMPLQSKHWRSCLWRQIMGLMRNRECYVLITLLFESILFRLYGTGADSPCLCKALFSFR